MKNRFRLEGIYGVETITHIENRNITDLGFDFRPKSFNFLQHYKFLEILERSYSPERLFWLHFENEHPGLVEKLILDSESVLNSKGGNKGSLLLEFSDNKNAEFYDQFKHKFAWNFSGLKELESVLSSQFLEVLILPFSEIENLHNTGKLHQFVSDFHKMTFKTIHENKVKLALKLDWDSDIFPSLFEFFSFDFCSLPVNRKVESSFRHVNWSALDRNLDYYLNLEV